MNDQKQADEAGKTDREDLQKQEQKISVEDGHSFRNRYIDLVVLGTSDCRSSSAGQAEHFLLA